MAELLIATRNEGKVREIGDFLHRDHPRLILRSLSDFPNAPKITEDGSSFVENARKKATLVATFLKIPTLADDSGLEVSALGGRPGILSARFAGPDATDEENNRKLLSKLEGLPPEARAARFRCAMILASPNGKTFTATGELEGQILDAPRGVGGFGYDPLFLLPDLGRTMAEMTLAEKNKISHRAKALAKISSALSDFLAGN